MEVEKNGDLNPAQREAVEFGDQPLLIVAGAGTGKTRVITRRVADLLSRGVPGPRILAITFTNKAAKEMAERVARLVPGERVWVSTFHAFAVRALRISGSGIGIPLDFTICDRDDQISIVRRVLKTRGIPSKEIRPSGVLHFLSSWKNQDLDQEAAQGWARTPIEEIAAEVYGDYEEELRVSHQLDFDDLLLRLRDLLADDQAGRSWRERFDHVLVDEFQDTNPLQCDIARRLVQEHQNLTACGDPDQSIYSWRGANVRNILDFDQQFPGAHIVRLEQNYRSTSPILELASAVISHNQQRIERGLFTENPDGGKPRIVTLRGESDEAEYVVGEIAQLLAQGDVTPREIAILYRTNALSRPFERSFRGAGIPYRLVGTVEFYARKEVRDLLAFLRLKVNPNDLQSFSRVVNLPPRGIGEVSLQKLLNAAREHGVSPVDLVLDPSRRPKLRGSGAKGLAKFSELLSWLMHREDQGIAHLLHELMVRIDFEHYLEATYGGEAQDRMENVQALLADTYEFESGAEEKNLTQYLEERALVQDTDDLHGTSAAGVSLMTMHSAKGLEFKVVFLPCLEQNILPHRRSLAEGDVEEERRLFYVGITRAREQLTLSCAMQRFQFGHWEPSVPSSFLSEIPPSCLDSGETWAGLGAEVHEPEDTYLELDDGAEEGFEFGDRVRHDRFGLGEVVQIMGAGHNVRLRIRFAEGEKTILPTGQLRKVREYEY